MDAIKISAYKRVSFRTDYSKVGLCQRGIFSEGDFVGTPGKKERLLWTATAVTLGHARMKYFWPRFARRLSH